MCFDYFILKLKNGHPHTHTPDNFSQNIYLPFLEYKGIKSEISWIRDRQESIGDIKEQQKIFEKSMKFMSCLCSWGEFASLRMKEK